MTGSLYTAEENINAYIENMYYNDVDENEEGMSATDPVGRFKGASVEQAEAVLRDFLEYIEEQS